MDIEERTETTIIALLNDRLDYWKGELEMLIEYFQEQSKKLSEDGKLDSQQETRQFKLLLFLDFVRKQLGDYANKWIIATNSFSQFTQDETIKKLTDLLSDLSKHSKEIRETFSSMLSCIQKEKYSLKNHMETYSKAWVDFLKAENSGDPWIAERHLIKTKERFIDEKLDFFKVLLELKKKMNEIDSDIGEKVKNLTEEFFIVKSKQSVMEEDCVKDLRASVKKIDLSENWQKISAAYNIDQCIQIISDSSFRDKITDFVYEQVATKTEHSKSRCDIRKCGVMFRQGRLRKTSWHPALYVITNTRFLHIYDLYSTDFSAESSSNLMVKLQDKAFLEEQNELIEMKLLECYERLYKPYLSLNLRFCQLGMVYPKQFQFEISSLVPGLLYGKAERKFTLRACSEEELVDWYVAIKEAIMEEDKKPAKLEAPNQVPWDASAASQVPISGDTFDKQSITFSENDSSDLPFSNAEVSFKDPVVSDGEELENPWE